MRDSASGSAPLGPTPRHHRATGRQVVVATPLGALERAGISRRGPESWGAALPDDRARRNRRSRRTRQPDTPVDRQTSARRRSRGAALRLIRPSQWPKNLLVFAAPGAAGVLSRQGTLAAAIGVFVTFCVVSSGVYCWNDALDARRDALHPKKRLRPVAAGVVGRSRALLLASVLIGAGLIDAWVIAGAPLFWVFSSYVGLNVAYSLGLKRVPYAELGIVATGFVLRGIGGGLATHVELSAWFVLVTCFGALMIVAGKRSAEYESLGSSRLRVRPVLIRYSASSLRVIRRLAAAGSLGSFVLWGLYGPSSSAAGPHGSLWAEFAVVDFVLVVLRLERHFSLGEGEEPQRLLYTDRVLQAMAVGLVALLIAAVYA